MTEQQEAKRSQKKGAKEILRLGEKALAYRRDILTADQVEKLESAVNELKATLKQKIIFIGDLEEKAEKLDFQLKESGGLYYHKKSWVENIEMLMVAAIVVIGIRSFFVQPFIIPTNSMYPSFYGMQPNLYEEQEDVPSFLERGVDKLLLGASHYRVELESSGSLYLVLQNGGSFRPAQATFPDGRFFIIPNSVKEYVFEVGGKEHILQVPAEFDFDTLIAKKFAGIENLRDLPLIVSQDQGFTGNRLKLSDKTYKTGDIAIAFDILLGDALFVDRMTYNFVKPKAGDPAVFRTGSIDDFNRKLGTPVRSFIGEDKYYIKRLVGEPGDRLQMIVPDSIFTNGTDVRKGTPGVLYRNDKPITGKIAFDENRIRTEALATNPNAENPSKYPGYRAEGLLSNREIITVPSKNDSTNATGLNGYFAMGDNSTDSLDGRAWGFVPENEIIGRALVVYYPFTKRWGFSN
ncbi:MAG: signal peptidase I [Opitutae bacterium]|jgi:signal peptidase I|nr:signal peptidase I [Opitutae bacterium]